MVKSPYLVIGSLIVFFLYLLLHNTYDPPAMIVKSKLRKMQSDSEREDLQHVLRRAAMPDKTVILTMVNRAWAHPDSILDLFLQSFQIGEGTKRLLNHLMIVALDKQAFKYCKSVHPNCFLLANIKKKYTTKNPLVSPDHRSLNLMRNGLLLQLCKLGYSTLFTEADVMWLRSPILQLDPGSQLSIACHFHPGGDQEISIKADGGVFYIKSDEMSIEFLKTLHFGMFVYPTYQDLSLCEVTMHDEITPVGMKIKYLNETNFGGFCNPEAAGSSEVFTMRANCCDSTSSKVHDLKHVLDDWRNITAADKVALKGSSSSWRAPQKCRG